MTPTTPPAVSEAMREAVARILDPIATAYGDVSYYGPETSKGNASARLRVALKTSDAILSGPIASEITRLTGERDHARTASVQNLEGLLIWRRQVEAAEADLTRMRAETERLRIFVQHCEREVYPLVRDSWALNRTQSNAFIDALNDARAALSNPEQTDA